MKRLEGSSSDIYAVTSLHGCVVCGGHDKIVYVFRTGGMEKLRGHQHSIKAIAGVEGGAAPTLFQT